jgi:ubiquinone/menaquinone biosynthesis C-methylase UbiE
LESVFELESVSALTENICEEQIVISAEPESTSEVKSPRWNSRMVLDVGCGFQPRGDVNCDLYVKDVVNHRAFGSDILDVHKIPNFVVCSGFYLPFKDGAFGEVICAQVVEHVDNPLALLRELVRVSNDVIRVETVHRYGEGAHFNRKARKWYKEHHISKFNSRWFRQASKAVGCAVRKIYVISYFCFPHDYIPLIRFPYEFGALIKKRN